MHEYISGIDLDMRELVNDKQDLLSRKLRLYRVYIATSGSGFM